MLQGGTVSPAPPPGFLPARVFVPGPHRSQGAMAVALTLVWPAQAPQVRRAQGWTVARGPAGAGLCASSGPTPVPSHAGTIAFAQSARGKHRPQAEPRDPARHRLLEWHDAASTGAWI